MYVCTYITTVLVLWRSQLPDRIQSESPTFSGKGPHPLLWAGSRDTRGKITLSGVSNSQNYCEIFIVCTHFTNMTVGCVIQVGEPYADAWHTALHKCPVLGPPLQVLIPYCTVVRFYQLSDRPPVAYYCCLVSSNTSPYTVRKCCLLGSPYRPVNMMKLLSCFRT
jgi:hypothetical protein